MSLFLTKVRLRLFVNTESKCITTLSSILLRLKEYEIGLYFFPSDIYIYNLRYPQLTKFELQPEAAYVLFSETKHKEQPRFPIQVTYRI